VKIFLETFLQINPHMFGPWIRRARAGGKIILLLAIRAHVSAQAGVI
jgi:hypothetical protein